MYAKETFVFADKILIALDDVEGSLKIGVSTLVARQLDCEDLEGVCVI
jgi:hypothetical protein